MLKIVSATALAVLVCAMPSMVLSADFDGSKPLLCATIDTHFCDVGEVCYRTLPATLGGTVELTVPAGAQSGQKLRLRGRGFPGTPPDVLPDPYPPPDPEPDGPGFPEPDPDPAPLDPEPKPVPVNRE